MTTSMMKCAHGHDDCGKRDAMINEDMKNQECPRQNETESWDYAVKRKNVRHARVECVKDLTISLIEKQMQKKLCRFSEGASRCLENEENEECEANQCLIGMKDFFRGHVVEAWKGVDFSSTKRREANKVVAAKYFEYYVKC